MQQRLVYVDMMRGIAILLVVAAHLIQTNVVDGTYSRAFMFVNSFHMPLFFAISGFIAQKVYKPMREAKSVLLFIKKKAIALLVPLFVWDLVVFKLFLSNKWNMPSVEDFINEITNPRLWFLQTLFLIFVCYGIYLYLCEKWNKNQSIVKDLAMIALVFMFYGFYYMLNFKYGSVFLYSMYFYMGVMISKYQSLEKMAFNPILLVISFFVFCMLVGHWDIHSDSYVADVIKNIIDPCAFIIVLNVCKKYETIKASKFISQWGRYSLEIYVAHWCLISICSKWSLNLSYLNEIWLFILAIVLSVPIVYSCIGLAKIIEVSPITHLVLYGRK